MEDLTGNNKFINNSSKIFMNCWKELRKKLINDLSDQEHLRLVNNFWSKVAISVRVIDWDCPETWQDPWQFINDFKFDESSAALGMFYTLLLSEDKRWTTDRLRLVLAKDPIQSIQRIILEVDKKWILNLEYNRLLDMDVIQKPYSVQRVYIYDTNSRGFLKK